MAPRKEAGVHACKFRLLERADKVIRVKRSGVMTEGSAFFISPSMRLM